MRDHPWDDVLQADDRLAASRASVNRRVGRRPALLMIDLFARLFGDRPEPLSQSIERFPSSCGERAWQALDPLQQLLTTARADGVDVIHTTGEPRPEVDLGGATMGARDERDVPPAEGYRIVDEVAPAPGELVIYKSRASAFFGSPLSTALRLKDVDTVVVGGGTTSGCVRASVVDAYSHGLHVVVVEEATFDRSPTSHKMNLFDMHHKYATVVPLETALAYLKSADPDVIEEGA